MTVLPCYNEDGKADILRNEFTDESRLIFVGVFRGWARLLSFRIDNCPQKKIYPLNGGPLLVNRVIMFLSVCLN